MGYKETTATEYKVGDMLYGQNSMNAKVTAVYADGSIDIQLITNQPGDLYYYFGDGYRDQVRKEPVNTWMPMPSNRILRNITMNTTVSFRAVHNTVQSKECSNESWWGNLYGNDMYYGDPPYGHYYIPNDVNQTVPIKDVSIDEWRNDFGLSGEWNRVPGSYRWYQSGNVDYYGWRIENNYGPYLNRYAKRFTMTFTKGSVSDLYSGKINISKIKVSRKIYCPEPIDGYIYKVSDGDANTYNPNLTTNGGYQYINGKRNVLFKKLAPYPAVNKSSVKYIEDIINDGIDTGVSDDNIFFTWTSKEDEDASKNSYRITVKFTDLYDGHVETFYNNSDLGSRCWVKLTDPGHDIDPGDDQGTYTGMRLAGKYEITVAGIFDGKQENHTTATFLLDVEDDSDVTPPVITDVTDFVANIDGIPKVYKISYNMEKEITIAPHTPRWDVCKYHTYSASYDYYTYTNEGYDVIQQKSREPFKNGKMEFSANGQYHIRVTATHRNGKRATTEAVWMIDTRIPKAPILTINNDIYEGHFTRDFKDKTTYLNNAIATLKIPTCTEADTEIFYKKYSSGTFQRVKRYTRDQTNKKSFPLPIGGLFSRLGVWKIIAKCEKTQVKFPDGSPLIGPYRLMSDYVDVIFAVKKKHINTITKETFFINRDQVTEKISYKQVDKMDEGNVLGYKVRVTIKYEDDLSDMGNLEERDILDINGNFVLDEEGNRKQTYDYTLEDSILKKLYKINDGDWKYYLDTGDTDSSALYLYENCRITVKSVDDDGFESYISSEEISTINRTFTPEKIILTNDSKELIDSNNGIIETTARIRLTTQSEIDKEI